ncbi:MAG: amino acid adenylation domain-containing protein [Methylococcales bacterium]|nr:amino acid adenylation domain-containing protein [Methylococcales bacterium]
MPLLSKSALPQKPVTKQLLEWTELKPEMIETMKRQLDYWKLQLANIPILDLPTDRPRSALQSFRAETQQFSLPPGLTEGLKDLSRREGATLFTTLATAFQVLLHRYSGQDDIVIGTPSAGRTDLELEDSLGLFVNTLLLRADLSGNPSFRDLLAQVQEIALGAYANQDIPFKKLVEALHPQCECSHNPLFQVMFSLRNVSDDKSQLNAITPEFLQVGTGATQLDLTLELLETPHGLTGVMEYATDLFEAATISRLIGHFQTLLQGIVTQPETCLSELPLLTESNRQQLLTEWNSTTVTFPHNRFIHHLFEEQVARSPEAVAVVYEEHQLTYGELNARANQLAHHLRDIGVKPEALVGICLERSLDMVVGLLGILKAGGAYLPLDPAYPKERLTFMLEDSAPMALLTQGKFKMLFEDVSKFLSVIDLSAKIPSWVSKPETNPDHSSVGLMPENLANVLYTSGSTGKPKGVGALHRGLQNLLPWYISEFNLSCDDAVLVVTSHSYDLTQRNIFGPLLVGARLVLAGEPFDPQAIVTLVARERISLINLTPSAFYALIAASTNGELGGLRHVIFGGEPIQPSRLLELPEPRPEFVNGYGPTECTGMITYHRMSPDLEQDRYCNRAVPIGRPIANTRIYILDAHQQLVPIGVAGEIHIGGMPVGRGYMNQPELTAERFVRDPFIPEADAQMYKTGDLARWLADGTIEFLGRNDFQTKVRGFRIELGEIESTLRQHSQLREVVVGVYELVPGDKKLAAYMVPKSDSTPIPSELQDFLKSKLPEFMIPSAFVFLDALPTTQNGKIDRKALPIPDMNKQDLDVAFIAPRNQVETRLAEIWGNLLAIDRVGIYDNFFTLGGHSLLATKMVVDVNKQFDTNLPLGTIYQFPTVEKLGRIISSGKSQPSWYSLVPIQTQGSRPPLFAIHTISLVDLPHYLGKEQPLYFLRYGMAAENSNRSVQLPQLKELASHYIEEMQQVQPRGPYYFMGFSFGGLIAYEIACQLVVNGHQVNFVGLLDTYLTREKLSQPFHRKIHKLLRQNPRRLLTRVNNKITDLTTANKYGADFWPHIYTSAPDDACRYDFQPKSYNGRVTLFQGFEWDSAFSSYALPEQAWQTLLGDRLEVQQITGAHLEICKEPHVKALAEKLIACMDKAIEDK